MEIQRKNSRKRMIALLLNIATTVSLLILTGILMWFRYHACMEIFQSFWYCALR